eukprot:4316921-Amphidinium_carterae.1
MIPSPHEALRARTSKTIFAMTFAKTMQSFELKALLAKCALSMSGSNFLKHLKDKNYRLLFLTWKPNLFKVIKKRIKKLTNTPLPTSQLLVSPIGGASQKQRLWWGRQGQ